VNDNKNNDKATASTISGRSAAIYFKHDPSLASLLVSHGISVRDFIMLSFLSDQGPMSITKLSGAMSTAPDALISGVKRLSAAGLLVRGPEAMSNYADSIVKLTTRGQHIAKRVDDHR